MSLPDRHSLSRACAVAGTAWLASAMLTPPARATEPGDRTADTAVPAPYEDLSGPDLSGTWRVQWTAANLADIPLLGDTLVLTTQVNLATVRRTEQGWEQDHSPCSLDVKSNFSFTQTEFPPRFIDALPDKHYLPRLVKTASGWAYTGDLGPMSIGFNPKKAPAGVPEDPDHPAVYDWDQDGHPGATVYVRAPLFGAVEVYLVQTGHTVLYGEAEVVADRVVAVQGDLDLLEAQQRTIGASNRLFKTTPAVSFQRSESRFEMIRVPDDTTCGDLSQESP